MDKELQNNLLKLKIMFYDPKFGFSSSINKIYAKTQMLNIDLKKSDIKKFIEEQPLNQILKPVKKNKVFSSYVANYPAHIYQIDILVYDRYEYNKYKYILVVIDIYSRYVQARAMTNRNLETILENYKDIIKTMGPPFKIEADNEFNKKLFLNELRDNNTRAYFFQTNEPNKNAIVERFNQTLARILQKVRVATKNYNWKSYLSDVIDNYNTTLHSTLNTEPYNIFILNNPSDQKHKISKINLEIGDIVRILNKKKVFEKGDALTMSSKTYEIIDIIGEKIYLNGIKKYYKQYELNKINNGTIDIEEPKNQIKENNIRKLLKREDILETNISRTTRPKNKINYKTITKNI